MGEAFAHHGHAAAVEAGLLARAWDFDLSSVDQPVRIWHGSADTRVHVETTHGLAGLQASVSMWPGHGHFSWAISAAVPEVCRGSDPVRRRAPSRLGSSR